MDSGISPVTQGGCALLSWIFLQRHFVLPAMVSSVGTCGAKEVCVFFAFFAIKRGKEFGRAELFLEKDEL